LWSRFSVLTKDHFYHVGGKEKNRNPAVEALVVNFQIKVTEDVSRKPEQMMLLAS
jgi:DNA adenine methylase